MQLDPNLEMDPDLAGPDLPEFEDIQYVEPPKARPSEALESVPPTPVRDESSMGGMEFDTPVVEVKRPKLAHRRKRNHAQLDKSTEIPKDVVRAWIMNPDSVSDIVREPHTLPRNRAEVVRGQESYGRKGDAVLANPLSGFLGTRLTRFMQEMSSAEPFQQPEAKESSKKRKAGQDEPVDIDIEEQDRTFEDDAQIEAQPEEPEVPVEEEVPAEAEEEEGSREPEEMVEESGEPPAVIPAGAVEGVFSDYVQDDDDDEAYDEGKEIPEQQERTKKVILMLQQSFKGKDKKAAPLRFQQMIHPAEATSAPSKHTAAVAFFELLNLNAKGFIKLDQPKAYGDILIAPRELLVRYTATI
mmetsp:Transcript_40078/g.82061  ORF Transcript_40078/g.82061 Transcript_40078/m.82061 type:complete len:356 (+) Transcript_40078:197-1264(+)